MSADYLKREVISHTRKVCSLYKRMSRDLEWWGEDFFDTRFKKLQLRAEFDKNKDIKDLRQAKSLLIEGEKKFERDVHPYHKHSGINMFPFSKDGIAYGRNLESPDYVMDYYHPMEKARYPYYFAKREQMKQEYLELWQKKCIKPTAERDEHH